MKIPRDPTRAVAFVLVAAVLGLLALLGWSESRSAGRRAGVGIDQGRGAIAVTGVDAGMPADRAGLAAGDRVLRIGDLRTVKVSDWDRAAAAFAPGRPVRIEVERDGRRLHMTLVPGVPFPWLLFLANGVTVLAYLGLGLLILLQKRRDRAPRLLLYFSLAVAVELALPFGSIGNVGLGAVSLVAYYLLTGAEIGLELHLASVIPVPRPWLARRRWVVPLYYTLGFGLGSLTAVTYVAEDLLGHDPFPWTSGQIEQVLLRLALPLWALGVVALLAAPAFSHPQPRRRQQAGLVLAGVVPWATFVLVTSLLDGVVAQTQWLAVLEALVLLCYPVAVFVAIFRYDLFDVEMTVRRSLLYGGVTGLLILFFYASLGAGGAIFSQLVQESGSVWAIAVATLLLGLLLAPLLRWLQRLIDRRLFPERHALRAHLIALASELPALGKLPLMGEHLVERICGIFGARSALLLLADPAADVVGVLAVKRTRSAPALNRALLLSLRDPAVGVLERARRPVPLDQLGRATAPAPSPLVQRLAAQEVRLVVPLLQHDRMIGLLALGPRRSGEPYRGEESELLDLLSHHVALVFENSRLFVSATYEGLTGLLRREAILERLDLELHRAQRHERPLTVGLADLDHFKGVNDRYGHLAGDSMLRRVAEALEGSLRDTDSVGRYGGEEFLLVLPETDLAGARVAAEKMREAVEAVRLRMDDGSEAAVTISIGLASLRELQGSPVAVTARELIAAADAALYRAKGAGRNRVHSLLVHRAV